MQLAGLNVDFWRNREQEIEDYLGKIDYKKILEWRNFLSTKTYGEAGVYSRDLWELERHFRQWIFVHDDMMTGGKYHDMITETCLTGRWPSAHGYTDENFSFFHRRLGKDGYPVAMRPQPVIRREGWEEDTQTVPAKIWGQLYSIRPYQFKKLDFLRENGVQFIRKQVQIIVPHQKTFQKPLPEVSSEMKWYCDAHMYVGNPEFFEPLLDGGFEFIPVHQIDYQGIRPRPWLGKYYVYQNGKYD